jgi:hypothetical protein
MSTAVSPAPPVSPPSPAAPLQVSRRAASRLAALLGINVWITLVMVPALYLGHASPARSTLLGFPLVLLAVAAARLWPVGLLMLYPLSLVAVPAADRSLVGINVISPTGFWITALSLLGYVFGAGFLLARGQVGNPTQRVRPLRDPEPAAWRSRRRFYRLWLAVLVPVLPVLVHAVNLSPSHLDALRGRFGGRTAQVTLVMNVLSLALFVVLFALYFVPPLVADYRGDPATRAELTRLRGDVSRGRPRAIFFLGVLAALALMALLLWLRPQK